MSITPPAPLKQVLKERLALGGGPVRPAITERPLLKKDGLPFHGQRLTGTHLAPRYRTPGAS